MFFGASLGPKDDLYAFLGHFDKTEKIGDTNLPKKNNTILINFLSQPKSLQDFMLDFALGSITKRFFQFVKNDPKINKDHL